MMLMTMIMIIIIKCQVERSFIKMVISKISIEPAVILMSLGFCMFGVKLHLIRS